MLKLRKFLGTVLILLGIFPIAVIALVVTILILPLLIGKWLNPEFFEFYGGVDGNNDEEEDRDPVVLTLVKDEDDLSE